MRLLFIKVMLSFLQIINFQILSKFSKGTDGSKIAYFTCLYASLLNWNSILTRENYSVLTVYLIPGPSDTAVVPQSLQSGMNLISSLQESTLFWVKLSFRQSSFYVVGLWCSCLNTSCGAALAM